MSSSEFLTASLSPYVATAGLGRFPKTWTVMRYSIIVRFRKDQCAITADIEQMFYRFFVKPEHRDYLRFFWFQDNNPDLTPKMGKYHLSLSSSIFDDFSAAPLFITFSMNAKKCFSFSGFLRKLDSN
jgi:hypothetical protein